MTTARRFLTLWGCCLLLACATAPKDGVTPQTLDTLQMWNVYGFREAVLVHSSDMERPILFFLHGGPGMPFIPFSPQFDDGLLNDFTVVHWDQPGAGKSYSPDISPTTLTAERVIDDGLAVAREIARRAPDRPIILVGHSWGTLVALGMAQKNPELFARLVLVGTMGDIETADQLRWEYLQNHLPPARKAELDALGPPPWPKVTHQLAASRLLADTGAVMGNVSARFYEKARQNNPYYKDADWERMNAGSQLSLHALLPPLQSYRAIDRYKRIDVPVTFVHGGKDMATPITLARAFYDRLEAPKGKNWFEVPEAAHFVMWEAPEKFRQALLTKP
ncbi:MAG: alpha/beta hydrolase [Myxococcaceae bacterium]|nr:alpha/beta hydrolase [Myxococcaceae bacterium]